MKLPRNYTLIIIAFVLGILLWLQNHLNSEQFAVVSLPLDYPGTNAVQNPSSYPSEMKFRVKGKGMEIVKLLVSGSHVQVTNNVENSDFSTLSGTDFHLEQPPVIDVIIIGPVTTDTTDIKKPITQNSVPIEPTFDNINTQKLYIHANYRLSNTKAFVTGPEDIVKNLSHINTQVVEQSQIGKDIIRMKLIAPSSEVNLEPIYVDARRISTGYSTRVITNIPIKDDYGFSFFPRIVSVRIGGGTSAVNNLTIDQIETSLDIHQEKNGSIPLNIRIPSSIELLDYTPHIIYRSSSHDTN